MNTAAFHATSRRKTLAALPSTVDAVKEHILNDMIWPNLTDEDGGVGSVAFQRLKEGGDVMVGEGEGRMYIDVSNGLEVKAFKVSHGVCTKSPPSHHHRGSVANIADALVPYSGPTHVEPGPMQRTVYMAQNGQYSAPGTPSITPRQCYYQPQLTTHMTATNYPSCVVDSTAFFVRDTESHREVLIFGDVEPDSISLRPRTHHVWQEAARKIAQGLLGGIFIESSYDDSQADAVLFGHMNPKHLIAELQTLAAMAVGAKATRHQETGVRKRKHSGPNGLDVVARHALGEHDPKRSCSRATGNTFPKNLRQASVPDHSMPDAQGQLSSSPSADSLKRIQHEHREQSHHGHHEPMSPKTLKLAAPATPTPGHARKPLLGIRVIIIHIKDTMIDGQHVRDNILAQLQDYEQRLQEEGQGLGCEFVIAQSD